MSQAVFVIDIASCTGCGACSIACKDRSEIPDELDLLRVKTHEEGVYPNPSLYYRVVHCFHCERPACVEACPVEAVSREENGLVAINKEECTGCGQCVEACPFDAVVMLPEDIAIKCDGCADEIAKGWNPTCVRACPMRALKYIAPEEVDLKNRVKDEKFEEHSISPAVLYLCRAE